MTTVLLADRDGSAFGPLGSRTIPALLPVQAVPVFERMLKVLVSAGIRSALVVTGPRGDEVQRRFGKGIRWGIALEYVRREAEESAGDVLRRLEHRLDGETLVLRADVGNHDVVGEFLEKAEECRDPLLAGMVGDRLAGLWKVRAGAMKKADFPREPSSPEWAIRKNQASVSLEGRCRLIDSVVAYREVDRAEAPVVSPRSVVYQDATLEAGTTVAEEAVVCATARLHDVSVLPRSVVPAGVSLENAVVSGNLVVRPVDGAASSLTDLLPPRRASLRMAPSFGDRIAGMVALIASLPLWPLALAWGYAANAGHPTRRVTWNLNGAGAGADGLPSREAVETFQFETAVPVLRDLPLVLSLASGRLALTGVAPLPPTEENGLGEGWSAVRREGLVGLLAPSRMLVPPAAPAEIPALMDAFEARRATPGLVRLALGALFGRNGWVAPKAFNPDEVEDVPAP
ncbi:MAG TPA: sugar phosphate nucleotidyltransferase [Thermoanaerobaculia bacterium]